MKEKKGNSKMWTPYEIKQLRKKYGETQDEFCQRLGVSTPALRHWEQGQGEPNGSAKILLDRLEEDIEKADKQPA